MPGARVETVLATMPGKDEVRAMLLAQLLAPAQKLVHAAPGAGQNLAFALDARKRQLEETEVSYRQRSTNNFRLLNRQLDKWRRVRWQA